MSNRTELDEIAHCGGSVTFTVAINDEGRLTYSVSWSHSRPTPAVIFAVYALPQGVAIADIKLGNIGAPRDPPPLPDCIPVFVASDSSGMFGRQCRACKGYWRGNPGNQICPYCGSHMPAFYLALTEAQARYVTQYCATLSRSGNKDFLIKRIIWRMQAIEQGTLSERAKARAMELARDADVRQRTPDSFMKSHGTVEVEPVPLQDDRLPMEGTVITREYKGRTIQVRVLAKGFEYEGEVYRSPSAVAKAVTGSHWNGYPFFNIAKETAGVGNT